MPLLSLLPVVLAAEAVPLETPLDMLQSAPSQVAAASLSLLSSEPLEYWKEAALAREDLELRWALVAELQGREEEEARALLLTLSLSDPHPDVRGRAALTLTEPVSESWVQRWAEDGLTQGAAGNLLLLAAADRGSQPALEALQERLRGGSYWLGRAFLEQAAQRSELPLGPVLMEGALQAEPGQDIMMAAAAWAHGLRDPALALLRERLRSSELDTQLEVLRQLRQHQIEGMERDIKRLRRDPALANEASLTLAWLGADGQRALRRALRTGDDSDQLLGLEWMARQLGQTSEPVISNWLRDELLRCSEEGSSPLRVQALDLMILASRCEELPVILLHDDDLLVRLERMRCADSSSAPPAPQDEVSKDEEAE